MANDWEQRKLGEIVLIERGGSPRPIDDYITNDADGLNWVKIGDAPEQGNYITKTAEKIKQSSALTSSLRRAISPPYIKSPEYSTSYTGCITLR